MRVTFGGIGARGLTIGIAIEKAEGEKRVALTPEVVKALIEKGFAVAVESGAGMKSGFENEDYVVAGATIAANYPELCAASMLFLRVTPPTVSEVEALPSGANLISFLFPSNDLRLVSTLASRGITSFAMDLIPRITRAQSMDSLSAMSTIAGYKGALLAANALPKFFPMFMTAAGTIPPAKVFVIGAGVAGLQAIATCKRLGAIVEAFDVRPAVKEQVESLGARFVAMQGFSDEAEDASGYAKEVSHDTHVKELELIASRLLKNDVVITTALIPGKPAPVLITKDMVKHMTRGSVIIDLAAVNGGNCEATVPGQTVEYEGVTIMGPTNLLSEMAADASRMYSKNISEFLLNLAPEGEIKIDLEDQIIRETLVTHEGKVHHEPTRLLIERDGKA